jgi:hypothetical protein
MTNPVRPTLSGTVAPKSWAQPQRGEGAGFEALLKKECNPPTPAPPPDTEEYATLVLGLTWGQPLLDPEDIDTEELDDCYGGVTLQPSSSSSSFEKQREK